MIHPRLECAKGHSRYEKIKRKKQKKNYISILAKKTGKENKLKPVGMTDLKHDSMGCISETITNTPSNIGEWMGIYRAYLTTHDGYRLPDYIELEESPQAIMNYFQVQAAINPTVIVVDKNDMMVAKMERGKLVFPEVEHEIDFTKRG